MLSTISKDTQLFIIKMLMFIIVFKDLRRHFYQQNIRHFILIDYKQSSDTI